MCRVITDNALQKLLEKLVTKVHKRLAHFHNLLMNYMLFQIVFILFFEHHFITYYEIINHPCYFLIFFSET